MIGAGKSGVAAAKLAHRLGAHVVLSDAGRISATLPTGIKKEQNGHTALLLDSDLLIRSPGVPGHLSLLHQARRQRIPIWSELEFASRVIHPKRCVAITGTNGKTTTTTLVGELFKAVGATVVAGNIGTPLAELASRITRHTNVVLEVSSYQLENIETFHADIAAILNVTPDHLEHHGTMKAYAAAKARVFENQTRRDVTVLNADDAWCRRLAQKCPGRLLWFSRTKKLKRGVFWTPDNQIHVAWGAKSCRWPLVARLPGPHNIENVLAAVAMAVVGGISPVVIRRVLERFRGVEHRLEDVRVWRGVRYVNDSKATNVDSTRVALESLTQPLYVILGGQGKGSPYAPLLPLLRSRAKKLLLIGEEAGRIRRELGGPISYELCKTMNRAVRRASALAQPGDVVLLSPACASFDQYKDYEERGRHFKRLVRKLE